MKTLILYATKYGAAREVARRIATKIDGAVLHDLKQGDVPSLAQFDTIIIGSPVYAGMIRNEAKTFLSQSADALQSKKLGLFVCGLSAEGEKGYFDSNFSPELLKTAKAASFLGGIFDPKKSGVMGRLIMKAVSKSAEYKDTIDDKKIEQFAEVMKT